jgi:(p)ppGpp synthase/HD superfamily hydrolase
MNIVDKARKFAERAHKDQKRRYTGEPYFVHLDEVARLCDRFGLSKRAIAAAYLHDTIEDQNVTVINLVVEFGKEIADIVRDLTDTPPQKGLDREARKKIDLARLEAAGPEAQSIKCADLISNTSSIVKHDPNFARTYLPEKRAVLVVLSKANGGLAAYAWATLIKAEQEVK